MSSVSPEEVDAMKNLMLKLRGIDSSTAKPLPTQIEPQLYNDNSHANDFYVEPSVYDEYHGQISLVQPEPSNPVLTPEPISYTPVQPPLMQHVAKPSQKVKYYVAAEMVNESKASGKYIIYNEAGQIYKSGLQFKEAAFLIKDVLDSNNKDTELLETIMKFETKYSSLLEDYKALKVKIQSFKVLGESANASSAEKRIKEISSQIKELREHLKSIRDSNFL